AGLARDAAERSIRRIRLREAQVRIIREVERLCPELYARAARRTERLEQREVPVLLMRTAHGIPPRVAERAGRRSRDRLRVEPEVLIRVRPVRERLIADVGMADEIPGLVRRVADARAFDVKPP